MAAATQYDHDTPEAFSGQDYFPEALGRQTFYDPPDRGFEREIRKRLDYWAKLRRERERRPARMSGLRNNRTLRFKLAVRAAGWLAMLLSIHPAAAETVEVAPGVQVTKRTYSAPVNEQPFFGFAVKTDAASSAADREVRQGR